MNVLRAPNRALWSAGACSRFCVASADRKREQAPALQSLRPPTARRQTEFVAMLVGLGWCLVCSVAVGAPPLSAGAAKTRITPPLEIPYLTSSGAGTSAPFQSVHDDLFARALVLDDGNQALALLAVDSLGYDDDILGPGRNFTRELRQRIAARTGLQPGAIMLAASHTHSGPETLDLSPLRQTRGAEEWLERHREQLADTVISAWERRTPVRCYSGSIVATGLQRYRRIALKAGGESRRGPIPPASEIATPFQLDETLSVLYFATLDGQPHSVVLNYTAHPVVAMTLPHVSADYPGAASALVEQTLAGSVCLFTNGCAGNINPNQVATNFDDVDAIGRSLGNSALKCVEGLKSAAPLADTRLAVISERVELPGRPSPPLDEAKSPALKARWVRLAEKLAKGPIRAEVQVMAVGPVRWVGLPGEPFVETGLALKQAGATFVVGYANGYIGYLPIRRAYAEGGYEVDFGVWSRVAPGSAEMLQSIGERLLDRASVRRD